MNGYTPFITVTGALAPGTFKIRYERIESMESTGNGTQIFLIGALDPLYLAETPDEVEALIVKVDTLEWDEQIENVANPPELSPEVQKASDDLLEVKGRFNFDLAIACAPNQSRILLRLEDISEHFKTPSRLLNTESISVDEGLITDDSWHLLHRLLPDLARACNLMLNELYMKEKTIDD